MGSGDAIKRCDQETTGMQGGEAKTAISFHDIGWERR